MALDEDLRQEASVVQGVDELAAERLMSLADAVTAPETSTEWLNIDALSYVNPESVAASIRASSPRAPRTAVMERARNVLVLLPILLTWAGLCFAAIGYAAVARSDPSLLEQPFLLLWEESFYGLVPFPASLLSWLTLSTVAAIDMITILIVVVLTWIIQSQVGVYQGRLDLQAQGTARRLEHLAWRAAMVLAPRGASDQRLTVIHEMAEDLLVEIRAEHDRLETLRTDREAEAALLTQFAADFEEGVSALADVTSTLNKAAQTAEVVAVSFDERIAEGMRNLERVVLGMGAATVAFDRAVAEVRRSSDAVATASSLLSDTSDRSLPIQGQLGQAVASLSADIGELRTQLVAEREASTTSIAKVAEAYEGLTSSAEGLVRHASVLDERSTLLVQLHADVERWTNTAAMSAATETQSIGALIAELANLHDGLDEVAGILRTASSPQLPSLQSDGDGQRRGGQTFWDRLRGG